MSKPTVHKVTTLRVDQVEPNTWNPNRMPDDTMAALVQNIGRAGANQPILVRPHPSKDAYEIIDGEHRWKAAVLRGDETIDAVIVEIDQDTAEAQTLAMNRIRGEMGAADVAAIVQQIRPTVSIEEMATFTGYPLPDLQGLVDSLKFDPTLIGQPLPPSQEPWQTLTFHLTEQQAQVVLSEVERLKDALGTPHEHLAVEAMAVLSSQAADDED